MRGCSINLRHSQVVELAEAWREKYPKRALGGSQALGGFHYQSLVALREILRAYLETPSTVPAIGVEQISDIVETNDDYVIFTQVKRTGRSVANALNELWSIHEVARERSPDLAAHLTFRMLCSEWMIRDVPTAIAAWRPPTETTSDALAQFKSHVDWKADSNPLLEIITALINEFGAREPVTTAMSFVGRLMEPSTAVPTIWAELNALTAARSREQLRHVYVWQPSDQPPAITERGGTLAGPRARLEHLRQGYFLDLPFYDQLAESMLEWLSSRPRNQDADARVPVLWVSGRSGSGKSVALLHVLARLVREQMGPIMWLGSGDELLPRAVNGAGDIARTDLQVILAVDDPFTPRAQGGTAWPLALRELEQLEDRGLSMPIIVCCGPSEQAQQLQREFDDQLIVETFELPDVASHRTALAEFYAQRTGEEPPLMGTGDLLPVQLFFEWRAREPLTSIARSLRQRLEAADPSGRVQHAIQVILSLNRLYVGYPTAALEERLGPAERDIFQRLVNEHHFEMDGDIGRPGVWLTHPHLADAIYEAWLPVEDAGHERSATFCEGAIDVLRNGATAVDQTAPLWALAGAMRTEVTYLPRMHRDQPDRLLRRLYDLWRIETGGKLVDDHLKGWLAIRFAVPGAALSPDPIDEALYGDTNALASSQSSLWHLLLDGWDSLSEEHQLRLQSLLRDVARRREMSSGAVGLLLYGLRRWESPELRVAVDAALEAQGGGAVGALTWILSQRSLGVSREFFLDTAIAWIRSHITDPAAGRVLGRLLARRDLAGLKVPTANIANDWLKSADHPSDEVLHVLRRLLTLPNTLGSRLQSVRAALDHIEAVGLAPESSFLVSRLLTVASDPRIGDSVYRDRPIWSHALSIASTWRERFPVEPGRKYVLDQLLQFDRWPDDAWYDAARESLDALGTRGSPAGVLFSLMSLTRRWHLLTEVEQKALRDGFRSWLAAIDEIHVQGHPSNRFESMANFRAYSIPLAARLNDDALDRQVRVLARTFLENAAPDARADFEAVSWGLITGREWPQGVDARAVLFGLGLARGDNDLHAELGVALARSGPANPVSLVAEATARAREHLAVGEVASCGFLLAKLLPAAAQVDDDTLGEVEDLVRDYLGERLPLRSRMGFLRECDRWVENSAWESLSDPFESFDRANAITPGLLAAFAERGKVLSQERLAKTLDFVGALIRSNQPLRAGLFLAPLTVLAFSSGTTSQREHATVLVRRFVGLQHVDDLPKVRLGTDLWRLASSDTRASLIPVLEELSLDAPWLAQRQRDGTLDEQAIEFTLPRAVALLESGALRRAGALLPPLLAATAATNGNLPRVQAVAIQVLQGCTRAQQDGFLRACRGQSWPSSAARRGVLNNLRAAIGRNT